MDFGHHCQKRRVRGPFPLSTPLSSSQLSAKAYSSFFLHFFRPNSIWGIYCKTGPVNAMSQSSLPTPPGTSHRREKENRAPEFSEPGPSTPRVVWAETNDYRLFEHSAASDFAIPASSLKRPPSRSILKKSSSFNLAIPFPEEEEREVTPEPSDPLVDLN